MTKIEAALSAAAAMRDALVMLSIDAEQRAADNGEDDMIEATPEHAASRAAVAEWDAALDALEEPA